MNPAWIAHLLAHWLGKREVTHQKMDESNPTALLGGIPKLVLLPLHNAYVPLPFGNITPFWDTSPF